MRNWRTDFLVLCIVQFVAAAGFNVASPFIPLYIQDLGVRGVQAAAAWAGIMGALGGITLAFASPIWGTIADRRGRKLMVERATVGASVFQASMGLVANVHQLVFLRMCQGVVSGVQSAVMALAATIIPQGSMGLAMGALQTSTALGSTLGPFVGGWLAAGLGYRPTFFVTGTLLMTSGLLAAFFVQEQFTPSPIGRGYAMAMTGLRDVLRVPVMPSLLAMVTISRAASSAMVIAIPLVLQEMAGGSLEVSGEAGTVVGLTALAMAAGALLWGRLGDRIGQRQVLLLCLIFAIVSIVPQALITTPWQLGAGQMVFTFVLAGLLPSSTALIGIVGPRGRQGVVYGASGTALALGNALGPTLAAVLIGLFGTRALFVGVGVVLLLVFVVMRVQLATSSA